jgi:hypothetical protein
VNFFHRRRQADLEMELRSVKDQLTLLQVEVTRGNMRWANLVERVMILESSKPPVPGFFGPVEEK